MRRKLILGVVIGVLFLFSASFSVGYSTDFPRHKNPVQIQEESFSLIQLIPIYGRIVSLQVEGKWHEASFELEKALRSYIPENLKYVFTRFNQLVQNVGDKLKEAKEDIDSAEGLVYQGEIEKAGNKLEESWMILLKAERDLNNLNSSVDELKEKIGGAAERLREEIIPLGKLVEAYKNRIQSLYYEVGEGKKLESTFLRVSVSEKEVVIGDPFEILGKLKTEKAEFLAEREVDIFLEKEKVFKVVTDENGEFRVRTNFPFLYKKTAQLFASFIPQKEDKERFYPSTSNIVLLEPFFYTPEIEAGYQEPVYPVLPFNLQGKLTLEGMALTHYPVKIEIAQRIVQINTDDEGKFQTELSLHSEAGKTFPLNIYTPSRGIIGPAHLTIDLPLTYKMPWMMIDLPLLTVAPFPLELKGEANLEGNIIRDAMLRVITESKDIATTLQDKSFKVKFNLPLLRFSGWEKINIFLYPQEAWISSLNKETRVLVINPLTLVPFIGLLVLFIGVTSRRKKGIERTEEPLEERKKVTPEREIAEKKEPPELVRIYIEAVGLVASFTGVEQASGHTIREYLKLIKKSLGKKGEDFEFISLIVEQFLYAPGKVDKEEERKAEEALERIKR